MIPTGPLPMHKPQDKGMAAMANASVIWPPCNSVTHLLHSLPVGTSCALVHEIEICSAEEAPTGTLKISQ